MPTKEVTPKEGEIVTTYDEALAAGYFGQKVDPLPDSAYTVAGSVARSKKSDTPSQPPLIGS